jgi:hypothetical protein
MASFGKFLSIFSWHNLDLQTLCLYNEATDLDKLIFNLETTSKHKERQRK